MGNMHFNPQLIAPCGMNCGICLGYLRNENKCSGCHSPADDKLGNCRKCRIFNCEHLKESISGMCNECPVYPCRRMRQLDERYRKNYSMSMFDNLEKIGQSGIDQFIMNETEKWTCKTCGGVICVHRGYCLKCK